MVSSTYGRQMLGSRNYLLRLTARRHMHNVGLSTFTVDYSNSPVVASVWHAFVHRGFNQNCDLLPRLICSENPAQSDFASFARSLVKKSPRPRTIAFRSPHRECPLNFASTLTRELINLLGREQSWFPVFQQKNLKELIFPITRRFSSNSGAVIT